MLKQNTISIDNVWCCTPCELLRIERIDFLKKIKISNVEYLVFGKNEKAENKQPHIEEALTGRTPMGFQRKLLFDYLNQQNVEIIDDATTHWCINKILSTKTNATISTLQKNKERNYLMLTEKNIEEQDRLVKESLNYGKEGLIIHDVLCSNPLHND